MASSKPVHDLILDAGPLITDRPPLSTLLARSERLFTVPSVLGEIRDTAARARLDSSLLPFLTVRAPRAASVQAVRTFARQSGDLVVLSGPDVELLALAHELECERNGGDWRLRSTPGQKRVNGPPPPPPLQPLAGDQRGPDPRPLDDSGEGAAVCEAARHPRHSPAAAPAPGAETLAPTRTITAESVQAASTASTDRTGAAAPRVDEPLASASAGARPAADGQSWSQASAAPAEGGEGAGALACNIGNLQLHGGNGILGTSADAERHPSTINTRVTGSPAPLHRQSAAGAAAPAAVTATTTTDQARQQNHPCKLMSERGSETAGTRRGGAAIADATDSSPLDPIEAAADDGDSDVSSASSGWITPGNLHRPRPSGAGGNASAAPSTVLQVATLTTDYAMQNVLLLMNLNLVSDGASLPPITRLRSSVLRCHACFLVLRNPAASSPSPSAPAASATPSATATGPPAFCPRCGAANTLTRVTTTTRADTGAVTLHLKKNMEWHHRGHRYSVPKPTAGSSSGRTKPKGGGQDGWGRELILAPDQKEYVRAVADADRAQRRQDKEWAGAGGGEWWDRRGPSASGGVKVGAGRNVNAKKKKKR